jgi:hypothetical protein
MTYHVVFDISERFPDAAIGFVALLVVLAMMALAFLPTGRSLLRQRSWVCLVGAGLLWIAFDIHNGGGPTSLIFAAFGVVPIGFAYLAKTDSTIGSNEKAQRVKPLAPYLAVGALLLAIAVRPAAPAGAQWNSPTVPISGTASNKRIAVFRAALTQTRW